MKRYYQGAQRIEHIGFALPEQMRRFTVIANDCRVYVDAKDDRTQPRSFLAPGEERTSDKMLELMDVSNISVQTSLGNKARMIYGRCPFSIGALTPGGPTVIRARSPRQMHTDIDPTTGLETSAARIFKTNRKPGRKPATQGTLYTTTTQVHAVIENGKWTEVSRFDHNLGVVPVVTHINRPEADEYVGESELTDIIPIVDSTARALTSLQAVIELHGAPRIWIAGLTDADLSDGKGGRLPKFEAYYNALTTLRDANAKVGQLTAADLNNFETAMELYGKQMFKLTGLPADYWGLTSANPATEGAIIASESRFIKDVESDCAALGVTLGRAAQIMWQIETGEKTDRPFSVEWFDPATPTIAQREDALSKRRAAGALSLESYWEELGWSEARIKREKERLAEERTVSPDVEHMGDILSPAGPSFDPATWQ